MEPRRCPACGSDNGPSASFCSTCGAALASADGASPTGWALATAGMSRQPDADDPTGGVLRKEECAGWWRRFAASILDGLILFALFGAIIGIAMFAAFQSDPTRFDDLSSWWDEQVNSYEHDPYDEDYEPTTRFEPSEDLGPLYAWWIGILFGVAAISFAWEALWTRSRMMGKPGQLALGFRVVRADDVTPPTTGRACGRAAAKLLYNVPQAGGLLYFASAFTIGLTSKRQGVHDLISGTACVRKSALRARGVGPDARGAQLDDRAPVSMRTHVDAAPNRGTTEGRASQSDSGGPFV